MLRYSYFGISCSSLAHSRADFYQTRSCGRYMLLVSWWLLARRIVININEQASLPGSTTDTPFKVELLVRAVYVIASYTDRFIPPCALMTPASLPITYLAPLFTQLAPHDVSIRVIYILPPDPETCRILTWVPTFQKTCAWACGSITLYRSRDKHHITHCITLSDFYPASNVEDEHAYWDSRRIAQCSHSKLS